MACPDCEKQGGKCMSCEIGDIAKKQGFLKSSDIDQIISNKFAEHRQHDNTNMANMGVGKDNQHSVDSVMACLGGTCGNQTCPIHKAARDIESKAFAKGVNSGINFGAKAQKAGLLQ